MDWSTQSLDRFDFASAFSIRSSSSQMVDVTFVFVFVFFAWSTSVGIDIDAGALTRTRTPGMYRFRVLSLRMVLAHMLAIIDAAMFRFVPVL
jgi:hypothetical protein